MFTLVLKEMMDDRLAWINRMNHLCRFFGVRECVISSGGGGGSFHLGLAHLRHREVTMTVSNYIIVSASQHRDYGC